MLKLILKTISWSVIAAFAVPTTLILISWNAVPGSSTYGLKVGLEKVILGVTPSDNLKSNLQIRYTARRFDEVEKVLGTTYADEGITNFNSQLIACVNSVKSISNPTQKNTQTVALVNTLKSISQKIETEKKTSVSKPSPTKIPVVTYIPTPPLASGDDEVSTSIPTPTIISSLTPTSVPSSEGNNSSPDTSDQLDDTQETIQEIIDELEDEIQQTQAGETTNSISPSFQDTVFQDTTPQTEDGRESHRDSRSSRNKDER